MGSIKIIFMAAVAVALMATGAVHAQQDADHAQHAEHVAQDSAEDLREQLAGLRAQVARLEAALAMDHAAGSSAASTGNDGAVNSMSGMGSKSMKGGGMSGMKPKGGMAGMGKSKTKSKTADGMGMGPEAMKRMQMMGRMNGMQDGSYLTSLPGFPGASHIYHVGATGHFLDHAEHLGLSMEERKGLAQVHEADLLEQATFDRKVEQAEQELWTLTSSDEPDAAPIEKKVREIAKLQAEQRLAFIRGVGKAAQALTDKQRMRLAGDATDDPAMRDSQAHQH